jgi:hypothetical protein
MQKITDEIAKCSLILGITPGISTNAFMDRKKVNKQKRGVYVIVEAGEPLYVGKGKIGSRHTKHMNKIMGKAVSTQTPEPKGWVWLREDCKSNPNNWDFIQVFLDSYTQESLMESWLIHFLRPPVNDEVFSENQELGVDK